MRYLLLWDAAAPSTCRCCQVPPGCPAYPSPDRVTAAASCRGSSPVVPVLSTAEIATKDAWQPFGVLWTAHPQSAPRKCPPRQDPEPRRSASASSAHWSLIPSIPSTSTPCARFWAPWGAGERLRCLRRIRRRLLALSWVAGL